MSDAEDEAPLPAPTVSVSITAHRSGVSFPTTRIVPDEQAVAFTYNGSTHAVMMATPADLEDFSIGFALTEGLIEDRSEIENLEIMPTPLGIEARVWLKGDRAEAYAKRRRSMAGPTGCGLCGIESLEEAMRPLSHVTAEAKVSSQAIVAAMASLDPAQMLNHETHAVHGAAFWTEREGLVALREDVGRHNALDKLIGALVRGGRTAADGIILMTSRVSIELIQKAARINAPVLVAVSAPTAAAIRLAEEAGITLVAVARRQDFEVFTHPERLTETSRQVASHVA
jgi:FdhD protein